MKSLALKKEVWDALVAVHEAAEAHAKAEKDFTGKFNAVSIREEVWRLKDEHESIVKSNENTLWYRRDEEAEKEAEKAYNKAFWKEHCILNKCKEPQEKALGKWVRAGKKADNMLYKAVKAYRKSM